MFLLPLICISTSLLPHETFKQLVMNKTRKKSRGVGVSSGYSIEFKV